MTHEDPRILLLNSYSDTHSLTGILAQFANVTTAASISDGLALAVREDYDVLLCDWALADGTWRTVIEEFRNRRLVLPVIVFSRCGNEGEWIEVLQAGGFDLLVPPYESHHVLASMRQAVVCYRKQLAEVFMHL